MNTISALNTLAHWGGGGPGPWILLMPLLWAAVIGGAVLLLRRTARRGGRGPWQPRTAHDEPSAVTLLDRRFASGEIDEEEYWRRLSVLNEARGDAG